MSDETETVIASEVAFRGRLLTLRVDTVRLPDGVEARREIVEHRGAACVVPIRPDGAVLLVRQFRSALRQFLLEIPAGLLEAGETPAACAERELEEETGRSAGTLTSLGVIYPSPGYTNERIYGFVATDLRDGVVNLDADERIEVVAIPANEIEPMIEAGEIRDAKTIAFLLRAIRCTN